jgi:hypothetical protein
MVRNIPGQLLEFGGNLKFNTKYKKSGHGVGEIDP